MSMIAIEKLLVSGPDCLFFGGGSVPILLAYFLGEGCWGVPKYHFVWGRATHVDLLQDEINLTISKSMKLWKRC